MKRLKISERVASAILKEQDHEVSMAQKSLDNIIENAMKLKELIGQSEKDIAAWIQDHISKAEEVLSHAADQYHEL